jgi:hypothetical protein
VTATRRSIPCCICDDAAACLRDANIGDCGCLVSNAVSMLVAGEITLAGIRPPATLTRSQNRTRSPLFSSPLTIFQNPFSLVLQLSPTWPSSCDSGTRHPRSAAAPPASPMEIVTAEAYKAIRLPKRQARTRPIEKMPHCDRKRFCLAALLDVLEARLPSESISI